MKNLNNKTFIGDVIETARKKYFLPLIMSAVFAAIAVTPNLSEQTIAEESSSVITWGLAELTKRAANEIIKINETESAKKTTTEPTKKTTTEPTPYRLTELEGNKVKRNKNLRAVFDEYDPKLSNVSEKKIIQFKKFYLNIAVTTRFYTGGGITIDADRWLERRKAKVANCQECQVMLGEELDRLGINNWHVYVENKDKKPPSPGGVAGHAFNAIEINNKIYYADLTSHLYKDTKYKKIDTVLAQSLLTASQKMERIKKMGYYDPQFSIGHNYPKAFRDNDPRISKNNVEYKNNRIGAELFDKTYKLIKQHGKEKAFEIIENRELVKNQEQYLELERKRKELEAKKLNLAKTTPTKTTPAKTTPAKTTPAPKPAILYSTFPTDIEG
jgi:ribosomal protein S16